MNHKLLIQTLGDVLLVWVKYMIKYIHICIMLKELQNNIGKLFLCLPKKIGEIKFTSHKQYLFGLLFSIKVKEDSYRPKYTSSFLICPNRNDSQTFKSSSYKKNFLQYYFIDANCFYKWVFAPCDNWKMLFFLIFCPYCEIFSTAILLLSLKQVFWKKSIFYSISTTTVQC